MAWNHLAVTSMNLTCLFFGAFTSLFMLYSAFFKQWCYVGEANIAFVTGIVFGPFAANIFNPISWGNLDTVVLECTRVVLVIQCFAVAVELRGQYVERHWKSLMWILGPVMVGGWMISTLAVYFMADQLSWKESMACAACFNAIDPILAATVVGKGHFAQQHVPKHLQNLLLAESACNGITTTLALELSTHIIKYSSSPKTIGFRFLVLTTAYNVILGALVGLIIGFVAQWALKKANDNDFIDRHSLLSFYIAIALLCAGVGSALGVDEVLLGFFAGHAFARDDWFLEQTEDAELSITIDLLLNLSYFVFLGAIIPWDSYNVPAMGISSWRLVVGTLVIFTARRVPVVLIFSRMIPEIKTLREALFYGHFGPIGPGAVFSAILVKATFESGGAKQLGGLSQDSPFYRLSSIIWPIVTFVVVCSGIVHGSSVLVWILGQHINTLPITFTYSSSQGSSSEISWMHRFPRPSIDRNEAIPAWATNIPPPTPPRSRSSDASNLETTVPVHRESSIRTSQAPAAILSRSGLTNNLRSRHSSSMQISRKRRNHGAPGVAYRFGNTILIEDDAGEVLKNYTIASESEDHATVSSHLKGAFGFASQGEKQQSNPIDDDGFRISRRGSSSRMKAADFISTMQQSNPRQPLDTVRSMNRVTHNMMNSTRCPQANVIPPSPAVVNTPDAVSPRTLQIANAEISTSCSRMNIGSTSPPDNKHRIKCHFQRKAQREEED